MATAVMSDTELQEDVIRELRWEPRIDAAHIGVAAKEGIVTLTGVVPSYADKYAAESTAKRVHGVRAVVNKLEVKLPGTSERTDEDIAQAALSALKSNYLVPDDKIRVTVENGWLTLDGRECPRGFGMTSGMSVSFPLSPEDRQFRSTVGLDDSGAGADTACDSLSACAGEAGLSRAGGLSSVIMAENLEDSSGRSRPGVATTSGWRRPSASRPWA